jgi:Gdp/GTP exchange factor required for growth at low temperatures
VRKLISVARDAKEAYSQRPPRASISKPSSGTGTPNGASRRPSSGIDEDLDLDFIAEPAPLLGTPGFGKAKGVVSADGAAVIQQPLHRAILEHRPSLQASVSPTTVTLPAHPPNALSRALASTMGRLGRWKRALNSGSRYAASKASAEVSAFDLELNAEGDSLSRGGIDQYLKIIESHREPPLTVVAPPPPPPPPSVDPLSPLGLHHPIPSTAPPAFTVDTTDFPEPVPTSPDSPSPPDSPIATEEPAEVAQEAVTASAPSYGKMTLRSKASSRVSTCSTSSSSSYGVPLAPQPTFRARRSVQDRSWQLDIVSIDDLDLSDTSSNTSEGPSAAQQSGPKRLPRRLPLRRDFEFVDRNRESVSSMGFASQDESGASASNSRRSSVVAPGGASEGARLGTTIHQWQVNALIDSLSDDEDDGDVEDALRRLEGQMNPQKQRAKKTKIDNWVKTIRERLAAGDYGDEAPRYFSDEEEGDEGGGGGRERALNKLETGDDVQRTRGFMSAPLSAVSSPSRPGSPASVRRVSSFGMLTESSTPVPSKALWPVATVPSSAPPRPTEDMKPTIEDVLPPEILRGRLTVPNTPGPAPTVSTTTTKLPSTPARLDHHRSWVLSVPTVALAIHFTMIDRELFLAIKFEELVSDDWRGSEAAQAANVLDWGQFLKDRARWKAQGVEGYRTSALVAARARFNLVTNFVISEIVDTSPAERPALAARFIRVAWVRFATFWFFFFSSLKSLFFFEQKCFQLNSFSTLVAIVAGLRSDWVSRVMKRGWDRVNVYNLRILNDLTSFADPSDDFKHIRGAVSQLADPKLTAGASEEAASVRSSTRGRLADGKADTGVPFLGE